MDIKQPGADYINFYVSYKLKLIQFNSTEKYKNELKFLHSLIQPDIKDVVLDYGCGIGTSVEVLRSKSINAFGYDVYKWVDGDPEWFASSFNMKFSHIYFMHSLAHIENVEQRLLNLKEYLREDGVITVVTPNLTWLNLMSNKNYTPDSTVVQHFTIDTLKSLFEKAGYEVLNLGQFGAIKDNVNERLFIQCK